MYNLLNNLLNKEVTMREIKFRAWNKENKLMVYNNEYNSASYWASDIGIINGRFNNNLHYIWMQYTGIKDKNGKEIYEGDIIRNIVGEKYLVYYDKGTHFLHDIAKDTDYEDIAMYMCSSFGNIIGNIYENKELLK